MEAASHLLASSDLNNQASGQEVAAFVSSMRVPATSAPPHRLRSLRRNAC
jgi:hypothetical protein